MDKKIKRTKIDKFGSGLVFVGTIALYFIDKSSSFLDNWGFNEFKPVIPFISALSLFCFIWSFIWENKIQRLYEKIDAREEEFVDKQNKFLKETVTDRINEHNKLSERLNELVKASLVQPKKVESRILKEHEMDLNKYLNLNNPNNEVALIYVITNDADVENETFGSVICDNIINNCYYIYVTPFEDEVFINKIFDTLLKNLPIGMTEETLKAIFSKRVIHFSEENLFKWLPGYSDFVIYTKRKRNKFDVKPEEIHGYYSFQNQSETIDGVECYFYNEMTPDYANDMIKCVAALDSKNILKDITRNHYSDSVKIRDKGLYCEKEIKKGEMICTVDGIFLKKSTLSKKLLEKTSYIQFDNEYIVETDFPVNHSCKKPNCGILDQFEIVAICDIPAGSEILIDYAFFDPQYNKFECVFREQCKQCTRKTQDSEEIKKAICMGSNKEYISEYLKK